MAIVIIDIMIIIIFIINNKSINQNSSIFLHIHLPPFWDGDILMAVQCICTGDPSKPLICLGSWGLATYREHRVEKPSLESCESKPYLGETISFFLRKKKVKTLKSLEIENQNQEWLFEQTMISRYVLNKPSLCLFIFPDGMILYRHDVLHGHLVQVYAGDVPHKVGPQRKTRLKWFATWPMFISIYINLSETLRLSQWTVHKTRHRKSKRETEKHVITNRSTNEHNWPTKILS